MIRIGNKQIKFDDILLFVYFAIMYAHNAPYPRLYTLCTLALFVYSIVKCATKNGLVFSKTQYNILGWYLLFVGYELAVSFINGIIHEEIWNNVIQNILMIFSLCCYTDSKEKFFKLIKIFAYAAFYFGMVAWLTSPVSTYGTTSFAGITMSQRNTIAYVVGIGSTIFAYFGLQERKKKYFIYAILCIIVTVLTGSRKGLIQLLIPVVVYILLQEGGRKRIKALTAIFFIGLVVVYICANSPIFMDTYGERFFQMFEEDSEDASTLARSSLAALGLTFFSQQPIFGYGLGASWFLTRSVSFSIVNYFHNNYVEMLVAGGIIGFLLYHWKFLRCLFISWKYHKYNYFAKLMISLLLIYFVLAIGQVTVYYATFYIVFFFILKGQEFMTYTEGDEIGQVK